MKSVAAVERERERVTTLNNKKAGMNNALFGIHARDW